jgi:hypothetical protein
MILERIRERIRERNRQRDDFVEMIKNLTIETIIRHGGTIVGDGWTMHFGGDQAGQIQVFL